MPDHDDNLPFPGMNPYLEARRIWPEVHTELISEMHYFLREALPPKYTVAMEERVIVEETIGDTTRQRYAIPDINVAGGDKPAAASAMEPDLAAVTVLLPELRPARERFIEIRTPGRLASVTILEVLSHSNKRAGAGRRDYLDKRQRILESATHLVEIDLLRANYPMPTDGYDGDFPYRILVSRNQDRPQAALYPFGMQSSFPAFPVPLLNKDDEPAIVLGEIFNDIYLRGYYERSVNYNEDPEGPISDNDHAWLDGRLRECGLRR